MKNRFLAGLLCLAVTAGCCVGFTSCKKKDEGNFQQLEFYPIAREKYGVKIGEKSAYLEDVVIPAKYEGVVVEKILDGAFKDSKVKSITIPVSVLSIGNDAFSGCTELRNIYYLGSANQWNGMLNEYDNFALDTQDHNITIHCTDADIYSVATND